MPKFRKRPVVIEAVQVAMDNLDEIGGLAWDQPRLVKIEVRQDVPYVFIETLEGTMEGRLGDWIIKGIKGELYPCKPDVFDATYEPV